MLSAIGICRAGLSRILIRGSRAETFPTISRVPSVDPPSITRISSPADTSWSHIIASVVPICDASLKTGTSTDTAGVPLL
jgi:hypothetical protein